MDAIVLTSQDKYCFENQGENIMTKEKLLAIGDQFEQEIAKDREADRSYR